MAQNTLAPDDGALPWLRSYPDDVDWHAPIPVRSPVDAFEAAVAAHGPRTCIEFLGKRYTYERIGQLVHRAACGLRALGVHKGVNVGLFLPNTPYFVVLYYAVLEAGGTVANLNPLYAVDQVAELLRGADVEIVATLDIDRLWDKVAAARETAGLRHVIACPMADVLPFFKGLLFPILHRSELRRIPDASYVVPFDRLIDNDGRFDRAAIEPTTDVAVLQFTGGTTGTPKAAMLSHHNVAANARQVRLIAPALRNGEERILGLLPLCHVFAMTVVMNLAIETGSTMILLPRFDLKETLAVIDRDRPSVFPGVPAVYAAINAFPKLRSYDLTSIRYCISGGASLPFDVKRDFERNTGCTLVEGYGLSESSPVVASNMFGGQQKAGSIGLPVPQTRIEIRALDDPSRQLPVGERGEICAQGPQVMLGYRGRPDATAKTIVDGFLRTGDVGSMDEDGFTFLVDRIKDVIVRDGYKAYPRVIEDAIRHHDAVAEVSVVGIPDARRGAYPKAFVRLHKGASLTAEELRRFLEPRLSPIEMPKEFEFRARLPRTIVGKPSKRALVDQELARGAGADEPGGAG